MPWQRRSVIAVSGLVAIGCYAVLIAHRHGMSLTRWPMQPVPGSPNPAYTIMDLGDLNAFGLNNDGQVTGMTDFRPGYYPGYRPGVAYGFVWKNGQRTELGTFGGPTSGGDKVNDRGQVIGEADTRQPDTRYEQAGLFLAHPFLWDGDKMMDLSQIPGYRNVEARSFAPDGRLLVCAVPAGSGQVRHAYLYDGTRMQDLGTLGGQIGLVAGINAKNEIIGTTIAGYNIGRSGKHEAINHACLWQSGKVCDLGTLGGSESMPTGINDQGQIVGYSFLKSGNYHAFLWDKGKMQDLGTLMGTSPLISQTYISRAEGINNKGQIVGSSVSPDNGNDEGFIWEKGKMTDLGKMIPQTHWYEPDGGWFCVGGAVAINEKGQIIGEGGKIGDNFNHSYLLTPIK